MDHDRTDLDVAERAHVALVTFLLHAPSWGPREIGAWLGGPYREATEIADDALRLDDDDDERSGVRPLGAFGLGPDPHETLVEVHERIIAMLSDLEWARDRGALEAWALSEGLVVSVRGTGGACVLAPVHHPGVALFRGLLGLFVSSWLGHPDQHAQAA